MANAKFRVKNGLIIDEVASNSGNFTILDGTVTSDAGITFATGSDGNIALSPDAGGKVTIDEPLQVSPATSVYVDATVTSSGGSSGSQTTLTLASGSLAAFPSSGSVYIEGTTTSENPYAYTGKTGTTVLTGFTTLDDISSALRMITLAPEAIDINGKAAVTSQTGQIPADGGQITIDGAKWGNAGNSWAVGINYGAVVLNKATSVMKIKTTDTNSSYHYKANYHASEYIPIVKIGSDSVNALTDGTEYFPARYGAKTAGGSLQGVSENLYYNQVIHVDTVALMKIKSSVYNVADSDYADVLGAALVIETASAAEMNQIVFNHESSGATKFLNAGSGSITTSEYAYAVGNVFVTAGSASTNFGMGYRNESVNTTGGSSDDGYFGASSGTYGDSGNALASGNTFFQATVAGVVGVGPGQDPTTDVTLTVGASGESNVGGVIVLDQGSSAPGTTGGRLYNNGGSLYWGTTDLSASSASALGDLSDVTFANGDLTVAALDTLTFTAAEGVAAQIIMKADESDDVGDDWTITSNVDNTFTIGNDISSSTVTHFTITPHATVANSTVAAAGKITAGGTITAVGSFIIGSADMSETDLEKLDGITNGTAAAGKAVVLDGSKNIATIGTIGCGEVTAASLVCTAGATFGGGYGSTGTTISTAGVITSNGACTIGGILKTDDTTAATSITDGSLQTDGGLSVTFDAVIGDDIILISDESAIQFGVNSDVTLTHVQDLGLTLSSAGVATNLQINNTATDGDSVIQFALSGAVAYSMGVEDGDSDKFVINYGTGVLGAAPAIEINSSGNTTILGNLTVSGTTTTVDSTTVTVDDPIFTIGGDTAPGSADAKDRGIEFRYFLSSDQARIGFFGFDNSTESLTGFTAATNNSEVFSGTLMPVVFGAGTFSGALLPGADDTYDLGSTSAAWQDLFLEGDLNMTDAGSITTSAGSLTLLAAAGGSFTTTDGTLTLDGNDGVTIQTDGTGDVEIKPGGDIVLNPADGKDVLYQEADTTYFSLGQGSVDVANLADSSGATVIDTFDCSVYQATKYLVIVEDDNLDFMTCEILLLGDDTPATATNTEAYMTQYAVVYNNGELGAFTATGQTGSNNVDLRYDPTDTTGTNHQIRVVAQRIASVA